MGRSCGSHDREDEFIQDFGKKTLRKEIIGGHRCKFKEDIKTNLRETRWW
jgi:hypothetical protein